ncbi:DUF3307 domain-containing protein [Actinoplanes sp. NEAU-A12]|uniref:DUF3307 domain-containing protein n=1 Tax=Actinoplanes sandaracinus TaxID=3045177 RepID=A0ABT6WQ96_9ACTN|nr:DUF3307 domain-containing protein [Actinoplanes sandaracinus]MDI6101893.1 DUF3307 domain-containing protein [Actinoplanes sandaracinus]
MTTDPAVFAAVFVALFVAHQVADHWVQTDHQAAHKGRPGWAGRRACAAHVFSYTVTAFAAATAVHFALGLEIDGWRLFAGLTVSAVTHYIADRRTPLKRLAELIGISRFYALGAPRPGRDDNPSIGTGAYALDQSFHHAWLAVAALIIA